MSQTTETLQKIEFDDFDFLRLKPISSFDPDILYDYDAVIIEYSDDHDVLEMIKRIRAHNDKDIYITPVFLLNTEGNMDDTIVSLADGVINNLTNLDSAAAITRKIWSRL